PRQPSPGPPPPPPPRHPISPARASKAGTPPAASACPAFPRSLRCSSPCHPPPCVVCYVVVYKPASGRLRRARAPGLEHVHELPEWRLQQAHQLGHRSLHDAHDLAPELLLGRKVRQRPELRRLPDAEPAILGEHRALRGAQPFLQSLDALHFCLSRHVPAPCPARPVS